MTRSSNRQRLLKQAILGFMQRHPECTMAGAELNLAGHIKLSQASVQKWRAGHAIADAHILALVEWAVSKAGMNRRWLKEFLRACDYPVSDLEARWFGQPDHPDLADLSALCQAANRRLWGRERMRPPAYYLSRSSLSALLQAFLISDCPGLILVGASGLGKTSLALWLASSPPEMERPVLVYPAALLDGSALLSDLLAQTLAAGKNHALLPGSPLTWPFLVIFDGVNESPEMTRLTWQIDRALIDARGLKVILTFRPESFQIARHSVALNEHCYFTNLDFTPGDGLRSDPPAVHLSPFLPHELPEAYERYQYTYGLRTTFTSLPASLKENISHPLTLRRIAETYSGQTIPADATKEVIPRLLDALVAQGRLHRPDVYLVEDQLVPLMLAPGRWRNAVSMDELRGIAGVEESQLWTPGEPGSFTRLADAGLLASTNGRLDEPVRFAHESFYEHFTYRRLHSLCVSIPDKRAFYADLATVPPFLYGSVRRLLVEEIDRQSPHWVLGQLASLPDSLATGALEDWCRSQADQAHTYLMQLWQLSEPRSMLVRLGLLSPISHPQHRRVQLVLIATARAIGDVDLLQRALLTTAPAIQSAAVLEAVTLWDSNQAAAQRLLNQIRKRAISRLGLPNQAASLAFVQLALLTLFDHGAQDDIFDFLYAQLQTMVRRAFSGWRGRLILHLLTRRITSWFEQAATERNVPGNLDAAFSLTPEQQEHLQALALHLDWETPGWGTDAVCEHVRIALQSDSLAAEKVAQVCLTVHSLPHPAETAALIRRLLQEANATDPYPSWAQSVISVTTDLLQWHPDADPELWGLLEDGVVYILTHYPTWHQAHSTRGSGQYRRLLGPAANLGPYIMTRHAADLPIDAGPVWPVVQHKLESGDARFTQDYLRETRFVALNCRQPRLGIRMLKPILRNLKPAVMEDVANLLAQIRVFAAEDVRDFLDQAASPELAAMANARSAEPDMYQWLYFRIGRWGYPFIVEHRSYRHLCSKMAAQVASSSSLWEWSRWSVEQILNVLKEDYTGHTRSSS